MIDHLVIGFGCISSIDQMAAMRQCSISSPRSQICPRETRKGREGNEKMTEKESRGSREGRERRTGGTLDANHVRSMVGK